MEADVIKGKENLHKLLIPKGSTAGNNYMAYPDKSALAGSCVGPFLPTHCSAGARTPSFATWVPVQVPPKGTLKRQECRKRGKGMPFQLYVLLLPAVAHELVSGTSLVNTLFLVITAPVGRPWILCGLQLWFLLDYKIQT